ncbi:metal-dependent hydrolase family protein [Lacticaseibacillus paracasei]|uniref:metal-dependent hydrolase family protein n=1 Tax=Lacticaseibacillus paracasei TaxID=1597 RepID=UPI001C47D28B|nr:amidohydrolase family protein [Lacticaseibacillus paracasei]QXJ66879.1 amidohydrolase family protein [Lacticaseibacillus paracasei subsp. paracasei]
MSTVFTHCSLFTGTSEKVVQDAWFAVDDDGKVAQTGTGQAPYATEMVDLGGQYVTPGLTNVHTHITLDPTTEDGGTSRGVVASTVGAVEHLHDLLKSGVTYIRECGSSWDIDIALKAMRDQGQLTQVPEMMPSGKFFSMTGGHGDMPNAAYVVDSPDEMRKAVRTALKKGAKAIKVIATGGVMTPNDFMDDPQLSVAEMHVAVEEAHHKGHIVAAHAEGNPGIMNAIQAGVDSIEHGFYVTDDEIDLMLKQGTYLTPTLVADWAIPTFAKGKIPDWEVKKAADALDDLYKNIMNAFRRGVPLTLGTDAGTPFNDFTMSPVELELMVEQGMTPFEAFSTSVNGAKLMGIADQYGTLEQGKFADFLVLEKDPMADVKAFQQKDKQVYQGGKRQY